MKRLMLFLLAAGVLWFLAQRFGLLPAGAAGGGSTSAPIDRARAAAAASDARTAAGQGVAREADQPVHGGSVTENMTPDQVRALLGSPDEVASEGGREVWTYRSAGKTVVFENGVVAGVR